MSLEERALLFNCDGSSLVGILSRPRVQKSSQGVLIIVGGPQYRVGSHRQFVLLARALAEQGVPCLRFDYRGMGDSEGETRSFEDIGEDIAAAIDCFLREVPEIQRVVLWGLCDAASAACFYANRDRRIDSLVLLNPWVRTDSGLAEAYLKNYYGRRLLDGSFWRKLFGGDVDFRASLVDLVRKLRLAFGPGKSDDSSVRGESAGLPARMARCLEDANMPTLVILSGQDYVAKEFENVVAGSPRWQRILASAQVCRLETADHTFSRNEWRDAVAAATGRWMAGRTQRRNPDAAREDNHRRLR